MCGATLHAGWSPRQATWRVAHSQVHTPWLLCRMTTTMLGVAKYVRVGLNVYEAFRVGPLGLSGVISTVASVPLLQDSSVVSTAG